MSTLNFPVNPVNGQLYPSTPLVGEKVYEWNSAYRTWVLLGTSTGVIPGTYGTELYVGRFTVDWAGRITYAENVAIQLGNTSQVGLVQLTDDTTSDDPTTALTAAQGFYLQNQIGDLDLLVPPAVDLVTAINVAYAKTADLIFLNPAINGNTTVQSALEDAVYGIASSDSTVTITTTPTGYFNIEVTQATETQLGGAKIATQAEVNAGTNDTRIVTPLKLSTYVNEGQVDANKIVLSPEINGNTTVQEALEDAVYDIDSTDNSVTVSSSPTGLFNVEVTQATETQLGGAEVATQAEVDAGLNDTKIVTPLKLASYTVGGNIDATHVVLNPPINGDVNVRQALDNAVYDIASADNSVTVSSSPTGLFSLEVTQATETQLGGAEVATQAEVNAGTDDTRFVTPLKLAAFAGGGGVIASQVPVIPPINGKENVQAVLEDGVYNVESSGGTISVAETAVGQVDIDLPNIGAIGSYSYASVTVDAQGRVTVASSSTAPNTNVVSPIINTGTSVEPIIGVLDASTTQAGVVQLNDTLTSTAVDQALTAAQGKFLQDQLNALSISGGLLNAGTFNPVTSGMVTVTTVGYSAGFTVGANVPAPAPALTDYIVQITEAATYTPPGGGGPYNLVTGDWLLCNGSVWIQVAVGPRLPDASASVKGIVQLATDAETQIGTDGSKVVTPASLSSRTSTEDRTGLSEIATQAEVDAGADDARYVTPLKLKTYLSGGGGDIPASGVIVSPAINGKNNVQETLENAVYSISSAKLTITETATGNVTITPPQQLYHYTELNDISAGFDGVKTTFTLQVAGSAYTPTPPSNLMVFLGGVIQIPGVGNAYTISTNTITFSEPPPAGTSFYATTVTNN